MKACDKRVAFVKLHARFGWQCCYCQRQVTRATRSIDHYLPKALGGTNDFGNLRLACIQCNEAKADMHPDEWQERMPQPVAPPAPSGRVALLSAVAQAMRARGFS